MKARDDNLTTWYEDKETGQIIYNIKIIYDEQDKYTPIHRTRESTRTIFENRNHFEQAREKQEKIDNKGQYGLQL